MSKNAKQNTGTTYFSNLANEEQKEPDYDKFVRRLKEDLNISDSLLSQILRGVRVSEKLRGYNGRGDAADVFILHPAKIDRNNVTRCTETVVVKAAQKRCLKKGLFKVDEAYSGLLSYFACCTNIVDLGILISDIWRPSDLEKYRGGLLLAKNQGIKTLLILKETNQLYPLRFF